MRNRTVVIEDRYTLNDSGTFTVDVDLNDPVTEFEVRLDASNGGTSNKASPLALCVDKIELVDGSDVLYSMRGTLARGAHAGIYGQVGNQYLTEQGSDTPYESFPIRFGRYLYDQVYAFNPNAHRNPQIKVTWNLANVNAVGATGYSTGTLQLSVNAKVMEGASIPTHFLMSKEIEAFTTVASGDRRIDMPVDYPWRYLLVRAYEQNVDIRSTVTNVKVSVDGDKMIPVDVAMEDVIYDWLNANHPLHAVSLPLLSNATFADTWLGMSLGGTITGRTSDYIFGADYFWKGGIYATVKDDAGSTATNQGAFVHDVGACLYNTVAIPFGNPMEPNDFLPANQHQSIKLYLTQGNASGACQVALQQARRY